MDDGGVYLELEVTTKAKSTRGSLVAAGSVIPVAGHRVWTEARGGGEEDQGWWAEAEGGRWGHEARARGGSQSPESTKQGRAVGG